MPSQIQPIADRIDSLTKEIQTIETYKKRLLSNIEELNSQLSQKEISDLDYKKKLASLLKGRTKQEALNHYNNLLNNLYNEIKGDISSIYNLISPAEKKLPSLKAKNPEKKPFKILEKIKPKKEEIIVSDEFNINKKTEGAYLKQLNIKQEDIRRFLKSQAKKKPAPGSSLEYTVYKTNPYSKIANTYMETLSFKAIKKYPELFEPLFESLRSANIKILSKTYVSILLLSTIIAFPITAILVFIFTLSFVKMLLFGILASFFTLLFLYAYPFSIVGSRSKTIKNELVFAIVQMSAIAGSGAQPSRIFQLVVDSGEYKELEPELRKILNYVNIFGYSLTSALRAVAATTPSKEFKELLNGIISTTETGGDIKKYLSDKAEEALVQFDLDQKKNTATIETYSDVYTGVLIAAPLLFIMVLAIIEKISPQFGGLTVNVIASMGTFVLIPFLNIVFILFLELSHSGK